jgi:peptidoglycan/LPS O-acetylase OafA/YrhL
MLGVMLYHWKALNDLSEPAGWILAIASAVAIIYFHQINVTELTTNFLKSVIGAKWHVELTFSKFFIGDYLLGLLVFLNFAGIRRISSRLGSLLEPMERPVRFLAGYTLSLYLLHQPLFLFWGSVIQGDPTKHYFWWLTTAMMAASVLAVGFITENRRKGLKKWLEQLIRYAQNFVNQRIAVPNQHP